MSDLKWDKRSVGAKKNFQKILIHDLIWLSEQMETVGSFMEFYGGFGEIGEHGRELIRASKMAKTWADGIEKETANGPKETSSPTKHQKQTKVSQARRRAKLQKPGNRPPKPGLPKLQRVPKK